MENHHAIKNRKPSISMGHLYHGLQMVIFITMAINGLTMTNIVFFVVNHGYVSQPHDQCLYPQIGLNLKVSFCTHSMLTGIHHTTVFFGTTQKKGPKGNRIPNGQHFPMLIHSK